MGTIIVELDYIADSNRSASAFAMTLRRTRRAVVADYREISQEYAKGGILAFTTINGGAAVALLTQAKDLLAANLANAITAPLLLWALGTAAASLIWLFGFASSRYVDISERDVDPEKKTRHLRISDWYARGGLALMALSLGCFVVGCWLLAHTLGTVTIPTLPKAG